jgi:hypothetical protein
MAGFISQPVRSICSCDRGSRKGSRRGVSGLCILGIDPVRTPWLGIKISKGHEGSDLPCLSVAIKTE